MQTIRFLDGPSIRTAVSDLRQKCFAFSPDYLAAVARRQQGRAGVFAISTAMNPSFVPVALFKRKFLRLATILAPPMDGNGNALASADEGAAVAALVEHLRGSGLAHRLTQPTNWSLFQCPPDGAVAAPFGSYVLRLVPDVDVLRGNLHGKNRNVIRNAERAGVQVVEGPEHFEACFSVYRETMARNNKSHEQREFLEQLLQSNDFDVFCGVAYSGERPVAALFAPYNTYGAYYLYGGTAEDIGINGANNLLHFEAIKTFAARGVGFYDFVGARLSEVVDPRLQGIQRFKSRFGTDLRQGLLWKQDLSSWHCRAYDVLSALRNRTMGRGPSMDIIDQERMS